MSIAGHATCFDASALVKLYIDEPGSLQLRQYWNTQGTRYTTPFCLYETLTVLKRHMLSGKLTQDRYLRAAGDLVSWFRVAQSQIKDLGFVEDREVFADVLELANYTGLDLSDAFQLLSLQAGHFAHLLIGDSATVLVTADEALAKAARRMKLRVWDCQREPMPQA